MGKFLPSGTFSQWEAIGNNQRHGIQDVMRRNRAGELVVPQEVDQVATQSKVDLFKDFLTILGTYCPDHFFDTVYMESTSYNWVLDCIKETFSLKTKGLSFLQGSALKFKYSPDSPTDTFTYQQGYIAIKEFYTSSFLNLGDIS